MSSLVAAALSKQCFARLASLCVLLAVSLRRAGGSLVVLCVGRVFAFGTGVSRTHRRRGTVQSFGLGQIRTASMADASGSESRECLGSGKPCALPLGLLWAWFHGVAWCPDRLAVASDERWSRRQRWSAVTSTLQSPGAAARSPSEIDELVGVFRLRPDIFQSTLSASVPLGVFLGRFIRWLTHEMIPAAWQQQNCMLRARCWECA